MNLMTSFAVMKLMTSFLVTASFTLMKLMTLFSENQLLVYSWFFLLEKSLNH